MIRMDSPVSLMHHDPDRSWITDPDPDHPKKRSLRALFFKKIQDWILKSERIRKWILRFFTRQISRNMLGQRNRRIHPGSGLFGSFDAP